MPDRYDVAILGGGPGGYAAALYGASAGLRIAIVEGDRLGGTCLNRGCIPAKELLQTAEVARTVRGASEFGIVPGGETTIDWPAAITRQGKVVDRLVKGLAGLLKKRNVDIIDGWGTLEGPGVIDVEGRKVEADAIILSLGSVPASIPGFDIDGTHVVTSDQALFLQKLPASVAIIGGGVIGAEFASAFIDVGVDVLVLEALPALITGADEELSKFLRTELGKRKVDIRTEARVNGHRESDTDGLRTIEFEHNGEKLEADVEMILVAVGRKARTDGAGLGEAGVELTERGQIKVDASMRTSLEGVWAVGDCVPTPQLAHVGYAEAMVAIRDILGEAPLPVNYDAVPWCVYTHPEIAFCGLTEAQAKERGHNVRVKKKPYAGVGRAMIIGETKGFVKIVADDDTGQLLGFHIAGPWATEQLTEGYLATNWEATVDELGHLVHAHPTLSEGIGEAALAMTGRSLHG